MNKPRIFISHAWKYNDKYYRLLELLNQRAYFDFYNHSVPEHDPLDFRKESELEQLLRNQMRGCSCIVVLGGVYPSYREWIKKEIEIAIEMGKSIIAIRPWGQERMSTIVSQNATTIVGWNTESVVSAIRTYG